MSRAKNEPIEFFENQEQLNKYLKEWQERLFLNDWNIKAKLVHGEDIPGMAGFCEMQYENCTAFISIRKADEIPEMIEKMPHEKVLVHELLHCKFFGVEEQKTTIEGVHWETMQHQLIEQMAKSLIMAKYNLTYDWFKEVN